MGEGRRRGPRLPAPSPPLLHFLIGCGGGARRSRRRLQRALPAAIGALGVGGNRGARRVLLHFLPAATGAVSRRRPLQPPAVSSRPREREKGKKDSKVCFSDDTLPDGFDVKRGDVVTYQPYVMGRMTYIWGEDAEVFRPERWLNADGIFCPESPFKFTAFQAGPRICLGKEFAYRQMKIFSATLVYFFMFKLSDARKPVTYRTMLTLHVDQGLHVRVIPRRSR